MKPIDHKKLILAIVRVFDQPWNEVVSGSREKEYIEAKRVFCYFMNRYGQVPLKKIATIVKLRNHATILYHKNVVAGFIETNKKFAAKIKLIEGMMGISDSVCPTCRQEVTRITTSSHGLRTFMKQHGLA